MLMTFAQFKAQARPVDCLRTALGEDYDNLAHGIHGFIFPGPCYIEHHADDPSGRIYHLYLGAWDCLTDDFEVAADHLYDWAKDELPALHVSANVVPREKIQRAAELLYQAFYPDDTGTAPVLSGRCPDWIANAYADAHRTNDIQHPATQSTHGFVRDAALFIARAMDGGDFGEDYQDACMVSESFADLQVTNFKAEKRLLFWFHSLTRLQIAEFMPEKQDPTEALCSGVRDMAFCMCASVFDSIADAAGAMEIAQ